MTYPGEIARDSPNVIQSLDAHLRDGKIQQILPKLTGPLIRQAQREGLGLIHAVMRIKDQETRVKAMREVVQIGANLDAIDLNKLNPLHEAVERYDLDGMDLLIRLGADINVRDTLGRTPLHTCATTSRIRPATKLISAGADISLRDREGHAFVTLGDKNFIEHMELFLDVRKTMRCLTLKLMPYEEPAHDANPAYTRAQAHGSDDLMACGD